MKIIRLSNTIICVLLLSGVSLVCGATNIIEQVSLSSRSHRTWEGDYKFSEETIVRIVGLEDLHVLKYRRSGSMGVLVDFAQANSEGKIRLLHEAEDNFEGVIPVLKGVDVLPDYEGAEIIVRWRHPGNGGFLTVDKYYYSAAGLELMTRSHTINIDGKRKWISEDALKRKEAKMMKKYPPVREVVSTNSTPKEQTKNSE